MVLLSYLAIYVIWGSTFLAIRVAINSIPPLLMMGVRCAIAGSLLLAFAWLRGEGPRLRDWRSGVAAGALMFGLPYAALAWAELHIASGMAALLVATLPLWLGAIEWARGTAPSRRAVTGLAVGFGGVILLVADRLSVPSSLAPMAAIVGGELAWALGSVYLQPRLPRAVPLSAGLPLTAGGVLLVVASAAIGEWRNFDVRAVAPSSVLALVYLIVFGSIVAFSAYMFLLGRAPASRVSTHAYVNPLIAVGLGAAAAGEPVTVSIVAASLTIATGVALALGGRQTERTETWVEHRGAEERTRTTPAPQWRRVKPVARASGPSAQRPGWLSVTK